MLDLKRIWMLVIASAFLVFPVFSTVAQAADSAPTPAICLIDEHPGILESDAQTAAMLVCHELRKQGVSVSDPVYEAPASANAYRAVLRRLGEKIFVRLSQENPIGTIIIERQLTLANIEEMIPAAPRLVDALVHRKPTDATVDMEGVTEQEARELRKISGESLWHIQIFGTFIPGTDVAAEPGYEFGWSYETPSYAVGTEFRGGGNYEEEEGSDEFSFFTWSIGGRYFFNKSNISPYAGGGLVIVDAIYETNTSGREQRLDNEWGYYDHYDYNDDSESDTGLGAYGVVGIEALRLTESRLKLELRIDRPFFTLPSQDIMPITFGISFSRNYDPGSCLGGCFF